MESAGAETPSANSNQTRLEIRSAVVGGKSIPLRPGEAVRLPAFPENIAFSYGAVSNSSRIPIRLRYRLEGYDQAWPTNH